MSLLSQNNFLIVRNSVIKSFKNLDCSGAALMILHNNELVVEEYWGTHSKQENARLTQADSKFHLASCRKSYIGFAVAYATHHGFIQSIDEEITCYLPTAQRKAVFEGTTIRHLLTHSHGLMQRNNQIDREFPAGTGWAYRGINIELLSTIVNYTTGKTIAAIVNDEVFRPLNLTETNWYNQFDNTFVEVIRKPKDKNWSADKHIDGSKMNMYASVRELATWGQLHLNKGVVKGKQLVNPNILELTTSLQSPRFKNQDFPQNGFLWFVKDSSAKHSEIGPLVPKGAFQILGYTGVTLLVIPEKKIVAVRAFNSFGSPEGYHYLEDVRGFGNAIMQSFN